MFPKRFSFLLIIVSVLLTSCGIETAKPFTKQHLFIASDCLDFTDTVLFNGFEKFKHIEVHIRRFTPDSLKNILKDEGYNTEFDAVILSSVYDMDQLNKAGLLQKLKDESFPENLPIKFRSASRKFCGIGVDPYVILTEDDSLSKVRSYKDLTSKTKWCTDLNGQSDWFPFYAAIAQKIDPKEKYNAIDWIGHFLRNKDKEFGESDSTTYCRTILTRYSHFRSNQVFKTKEFKDHRIIFPNQRSGGCYFNMPCYAVIKQARNYSNAIEFMRYLLLEPVNKRLNFRLSMFPVIKETNSSISYQNIRFKKYAVSPVRLTSNYERLINILRIID
jgi:ABC-type Fe3+ transport system substrate-binding protein